MNDKHRIIITFSIPLFKAIREVAHINGISIAEVVRRACRYYLLKKHLHLYQDLLEH